MKSDAPPPPRPRSIAFAAIPALALTLGIPLANHERPEVLGLPFLLVYIVAWIVATPLFLILAYRTESERG